MTHSKPEDDAEESAASRPRSGERSVADALAPIDSGVGDDIAEAEAEAAAQYTLAALLAKLRTTTQIDEKYELQSIIGRGGMGVVVGARHLDLGRDVALKFLCYGAGSTATGDLRARFRREAQINAKLKNEHITRVLDTGVWLNAPYIVMERLEGMNLRRKMKDAGGCLPIRDAVRYALQICEGIAEAHAHGIVHRDLKPSNIYVTTNTDGSDLLKIMDFGISKWSQHEIGEITKEGTVLGSPKYMAPEQIFGSKTIDARADVWAIGAILYEMIAGRTPYNEATLPRFCAELMAGPPPRLDTLKPEVSEGLAKAIARCFERMPENRVASVADFAGDLVDALDGDGAGFELRDKLGAILAMRLASPRTDPSPLSGNALAHLGPVSSISQSAARAVLAHTSPTPVYTAVSRVASTPPPSSLAKRWPMMVAGFLAACVAGAVLASMMNKSDRKALAAPTATATAANDAPAATAASAVTVKPTAAATAPAPASPAASSEPSAAASAPEPPKPDPTKAQVAPRAAPRVAPPRPAPPSTAASPPKTKPKGEDDIPSMR